MDNIFLWINGARWSSSCIAWPPLKFDLLKIRKKKWQRMLPSHLFLKGRCSAFVQSSSCQTWLAGESSTQLGAPSKLHSLVVPYMAGTECPVLKVMAVHTFFLTYREHYGIYVRMSFFAYWGTPQKLSFFFSIKMIESVGPISQPFFKFPNL